MEAHVGQWWHRAVQRLAGDGPSAHAVMLTSMRATLVVLHRSAGGHPGQRLAPASAQTVGGARRFWQRVAGSGLRATLAEWSPEVWALPPWIDCFDDAQDNRALYRLLALQCGAFRPAHGWVADNLHALALVRARFAGMNPVIDRLTQRLRALRPAPAAMPGAAQDAEAALQRVLDGQPPDALALALRPDALAPYPLWVQAVPPQTQGEARAQPPDPPSASTDAARDATRRRSQRLNRPTPRAPLVLPFHTESLLTWDEYVPDNRADDDDDSAAAPQAADDMDRLSLSAGPTRAARVRFDLDLPSASADDVPLGPGLLLPEWDAAQQRLRPAHVRVQVVQSPAQAPQASFGPALRLHARRLRRRLEGLQAAPQQLRAQVQGDAIDIDACIRHAAQVCAGHVVDASPAIYTRNQAARRSLATLLLADFSLSTDAYANDQQRIIDVIREALFVFAQALAATGDAFALWGFSSVRRDPVRLNHIKAFDAPWNDAARARLAAIRPGYYTRMGAAIRFATRELGGRSERQRLLMLLTDGKPNDLDAYEGRYGLEDTRHAVHEARQAGLIPFCVTIDAQAHDYLPHLFGARGYTLIHSPSQLVERLTQVWLHLSHPERIS